MIVQWSMQSLLCYKCSLEWDLQNCVSSMNNSSRFKRTFSMCLVGHTLIVHLSVFTSLCSTALSITYTVLCAVPCCLMPSRFTIHSTTQDSISHCYVFSNSVHCTALLLSTSHPRLDIMSYSQYHNIVKHSFGNGIFMLIPNSAFIITLFRWGKRVNGVLVFYPWAVEEHRLIGDFNSSL